MNETQDTGYRPGPREARVRALTAASDTCSGATLIALHEAARTIDAMQSQIDALMVRVLFLETERYVPTPPVPREQLPLAQALMGGAL